MRILPTVGQCLLRDAKQSDLNLGGQPFGAARFGMDPYEAPVCSLMLHRDPLQRGLVWPQRLRVAFGYPADVRDVPVSVTGSTVVVPGFALMVKTLLTACTCGVTVTRADDAA